MYVEIEYYSYIWAEAIEKKKRAHTIAAKMTANQLKSEYSVNYTNVYETAWPNSNIITFYYNKNEKQRNVVVRRTEVQTNVAQWMNEIPK